MNLKKGSIILFCKVALIFGVLGFWTLVFVNFEVLTVNEKVTLWVNAPSIVEDGEEFELNVEAWDKFERLAGDYDKEITFYMESYHYNTLEKINSNHDLPSDYTFTSNFFSGSLYPAYKVKGADNGKSTFTAKIQTQGIHYIVVEEKETGERYRSNPIIVKAEVSNRLYWGDVHGHTLLSDGSGLQAESYEFARDVALLDFAALTDHSEHFPRAGDADVFNIYTNYIKTTNDFNNDGSFATLVAMEWTPYYLVRGKDVMHGHLNVYFEGDDMPFFSTFTHQNQDDLYDYIKANTNDRFLSWMHHPLNGQFGSDFAFYDEEINRLIEIYSVHGSSETVGEDNLYNQNIEINDPGYSVRDGLKMGRKYGMMASGDNHDGRLCHSISHTEASAFNQYPYTLSGYRIGHPHQNGLTGIFADNITRRNVFNALYTRSCYATTWVNRHYIEFSINGRSVGGTDDSTLVLPDKSSTREIEILIAADGVSMEPDRTTKIVEVSIYKNSELWKRFDEINGPLFRKLLIDTEEITGTSYDECIIKDGKSYVHDQSIKEVNPDDLTTNGADYYYVRMRDSNGGASWLGPIWVEVG